MSSQEDLSGAAGGAQRKKWLATKPNDLSLVPEHPQSSKEELIPSSFLYMYMWMEELMESRG